MVKKSALPLLKPWFNVFGDRFLGAPASRFLPRTRSLPDTTPGCVFKPSGPLLRPRRSPLFKFLQETLAQMNGPVFLLPWLLFRIFLALAGFLILLTLVCPFLNRKANS